MGELRFIGDELIRIREQLTRIADSFEDDKNEKALLEFIEIIKEFIEKQSRRYWEEIE